MHDYLNKMYLHMYLILRRKTSKGWEGSRMHLSGHTLYWIHEGEGRFESTETKLVSSGTLLYASPGQKVQYRSADKHPMEFSIIRFECLTVDDQTDAWTLEPVNHLDLPFYMPSSGVNRVEMDGLIESLITPWNPASIGGEVRTKAALSEILLYASKYLITSKEQTSHTIFKRIKETIQLQYPLSLSVESLARDHGISPVYLRKLFHANEGCKPKQYLETIRYQNAVRLLLHSDLTLRMIAEVCGYTDEFHFSKVFLKKSGLAPATYKKQMIDH